MGINTSIVRDRALWSRWGFLRRSSTTSSHPGLKGGVVKIVYGERDTFEISMCRTNADGAHAGREGCCNAGKGVLKDNAVLRRGVEAAGNFQIDVGRWFGVF